MDKYAAQKKWKKTHLNEWREYNRKWAKEYRKKNPDKLRLINFRSKLKKEFRENGLKVLNRDQGLCQKCKIPCIDLLTFQSLPPKFNSHTWEIHHIDFDETNISLENLVLLCAKCHKQFHSFFLREIPSYIKQKIFDSWIN